jgi:predicted DnaQ family exonuclease/DinG family helicase
MPKFRDMLSSQQKRTLHKASRRSEHTTSSDDFTAYREMVALDVETTGLNAKTDRIIEVGAVKYTKGTEVDSYSCLVDPGCAIPPYISRITGIYDSDIDQAPTFGEIADQLRSFIGNAPICGHKVEFDITFVNRELERIGAPAMKNSSIDTLQLSRIVHPGLRSYRLYSVCKEEGYTIESAHRALDDAKAAGFLCNVLLPALLALPDDIKHRMAMFAPRSYIKKMLRDSISTPAGSLHYTIAQDRDTYRGDVLSACDGHTRIESSRVHAAFDAEGEIAQILPQFLFRKAQQDMALLVTGALNERTCAAIEAETGIGKSLAYMYPACCYALANGCRVFVSTYTKQLQDQLITKELAALAPLFDKTLRYTVLKGRRNYLCQYRFQRLLSHQLGNLSPTDRNACLPLIRWAAETKTGDIEELSNFQKRNAKIWDLISGDSSECRGGRCVHYDDCFVQRARQRALRSHIVVINHSLFFSDMHMDSSFLGQPGALLFDEAHHLEESGHQNLKVVVDSNGTMLLLESIANFTTRLKQVKETHVDADTIQRMKSCARSLRKKTGAFLHDVALWARKHDSSHGIYTLAYTPHEFDSFTSFAGLKIALDEMVDVCTSLRSMFIDDEAHEDDDEDMRQLRSELISCSRRVSQYRADIAYLAAGANEGDVFWVEGNHTKGWVKLCGVALDIGAVLAPVWQRNEVATVFTSGTLSACGSMNYMLDKIGFREPPLREEIETAQFRAPFSEAQRFNAAIALWHEPDAPEYPESVAVSLQKMFYALQKNMLVLFTSHEMVRAVYEKLRDADAIDPARIFAQNITGNRGEVLHLFCTTTPSVLLGTSSFWEGIDAPGQSCEIVVVPRLPFPVPTNPIIQALTAKYEQENGNAFTSYFLPEAMIRLKQASGRLIRSVNDRGAFIILDKRIMSRSYGKTIMRSLEGTFSTFPTVGECCNALQTFFTQTETHTDQSDGSQDVRYVPFSDV